VRFDDVRFKYLVLPGLALALASMAVACDFDTNSGSGGGGDTPASATPDPTIRVVEGSALHEARKLAAKEFGVELSDVKLSRLQHAGWDGCLGVYAPDAACTQQLIGGYIAFFQAGDEEARFHIGGNELVGPVDPSMGRIDDGMEVPAEIRTDFNQVLAAYAVHDLMLRKNLKAQDITVKSIVPVTFPDLCLGFMPKGQDMCASAIAEGAIVTLGAGNAEYVYHVSDHGVVATDFEDGEVTMEAPADLVSVQKAMREDLASRMKVAVEEVSVVKFELVTWRDGCLGVEKPDQICTQALVDGFLAVLTDGSGKGYRYHGAGDHFIAATFEQGATLQEPLREED
jgi:hypothetical protein